MTSFKLPRLFLALVTVLTIASTTTGEESTHPAMKDPSKATETAPVTFTAKFETTKGDIEFECVRDWAPHGVDRFYNLVKIGYFQDVQFFRVIKGFMAQFGIHGNPEVSKHWRSANLAVDPVKKSNTRGFLTYAMAGSPTTRSTQLFINYGNNARLDKTGFAPICKVSKGMEVADNLFNEYGDRPSGRQSDIQSKGNAYLKEAWPKLDSIVKTSIVKEGDKAPAPTDSGGKKDSGSGILPPAEEKSDTSTYIIVGLLAAGALLAFMFMRNNEEEEEEAPRPRKKRAKKASSKKASTKKTSSKKTGSKKTGSKKTRKKKRAKKPATSSDD